MFKQQMSQIRPGFLFAMGSLCLALTGCNKSSLSTIPVEGTITFKGQPVENCEIVFQPVKLVDGSVNRLALGRTDAKGKYVLSSVTHGDGAQAGDYSVVLVSRAGSRIIDAEAVAPVSNLPAVYTTIDTTPLRATVSADAPRPVQLNFDLKE